MAVGLQFLHFVFSWYDVQVLSDVEMIPVATVITDITFAFRGKSPIMGRFANMGRCIISYQEVLRSVLRNVNH
jgi:hypothetical protein